MTTAYCNTCGGTYASTLYDNNRCSRCGNLFNAMALTTSAQRSTTAVSLITNSSSDEAKRAVAEANSSGLSVTHENAQGSLSSGNYRAEQLQYDPRSGNFSYSRTVFKR